VSLHAVERVFWEFGHDPANIERFHENPDAHLAPYNLEAEERRAIMEVDLKSLSEQGMNPLLALMIWPLLKGPEGMPFTYLEHMNGGKLPDGGGKQA